ncbi:MAG: hypothetical protein AMXMBFR19_07520 [Chthonomonadaceae bacterium]
MKIIFERLRSTSIRVKLTVFFAGLSCLALVGASAAIFTIISNKQKSQLLDQSAALSGVIAQNISAAVAFGDKEAAYRMLSSLSTTNDFESAAVYDSEGQLLSAWKTRRSTVEPSLAAKPQVGAFIKHDRIQAVAEVKVQGEVLGHVVSYGSMEPFLKQQNDFLRMIMTVVLLTIAGSVLIGSVVQRLISRPIVKLLTTLKSVGESGDYSVRLESKNNDELGQLIHQFNRTIQEVERRDAELYRDKQSLESRVRQRTVELEREIVERERMQEELRQSTARLQDFIDNAPVGIKWLGPDGTIQDANLAELNIVKLDRESYLGNKFRMYFVDPGEADRILGLLLSGATVESEDALVISSSGEIRTVEISANAMRSGGSVTHFRCFMRDVTEIKAAEEAEREREEAERRNQAKNEFLSRMSHELRTPMNSILGFAQLLEMEELSERQRNNVRHILRGGRHLLNLINEVLNISRIESGAISVSLESLAFEPVIEEVLGLIKPMAEQSGISVEAPAKEQASQWFLGDKQSTIQILINLMSNAIKYNSPNGVARIRIENVDSENVRLMIEDTGPGVPTDRASRLFTPFDRLGAEQSKVEGTGLGLAHSRRLAEAMGATLEFDSSYEGGARFLLTLPTGRSMSLEESASSRVASSTRYTVLLVEDNQANIKLIESILNARGDISLLVSMQGSLGVEIAKKHNPDLILLDSNLPDITGAEVLKEIRADSALQSTPVIVISASNDKDSLATFHKYGVVANLSKPLDIEQFQDALNSLLKSERNHAA